MDDIIYIQGSDAYSYLQHINMIDDEDHVVAFPMSLGDELSFLQEQDESLLKQKMNKKYEMSLEHEKEFKLIMIHIWGFELIGLKFRFWLTILMILLIKAMIEVTVWDFFMLLIGVAFMSKVVKETKTGSSLQYNNLKQVQKLLSKINELILQKSKDGIPSPRVNLIWKNTLKICSSLLKILPTEQTQNIDQGEFLDCVTIYRKICSLNKSLSKYYFNCFVDKNKSIRFWELVQKVFKFNQLQMESKFSLEVLGNYYKYVFDEQQGKGREIMDEMNEGNGSNENYNDGLIQQLAYELHKADVVGKDMNKSNLKSIIGLIKLEIIFKPKTKSQQIVSQVQQVIQDSSAEGQNDQQEDQRRRRNLLSFSISTQDQIYQVITPHQKSIHVSILKQKLDHIMCQQEAKDRQKDLDERKEKIEVGKKEQKYEKRIQGFGLVIGLPKPKQMESFYLQ